VQLTYVPNQPALQRQAATAVLATDETVFAGQPTQPEFPVSSLYVPVTHPTHVSLFAPFHPALQMQAVIAMLLAGETLFVGQF